MLPLALRILPWISAQTPSLVSHRRVTPSQAANSRLKEASYILLTGWPS